MRIVRHALLAAASIFGMCGAAGAAWHKASTKHFIIYSEQKPEQLRQYAEKLERFDQAVRKVRGSPDPAIGDGNRLTVFVVKSVDAIRQLHGRGNDSVYGFYVPRYSGSYAFVPARADEDAKFGLSATTVFFHEYSHHIMFQTANVPFPNWFVEGFAELFSTAKIEKDSSVTLGISPAHRAYGLFSGEGLTAREVLEAQPAKMTEADRESIYGRGWLLTHYLTFEKSRHGQLGSYLNKLADGQSMAQAAREAFGDLKQLDKELGSYVRRRKLSALSVPAAALNLGPIEITPLSQGAGEAMQWRIMSKRGVDAKEAQTVVTKIREIAARHPRDAVVQVTLAEAEHDVGNFQAARTAAEAAAKADPRMVEAQTFKGRALAELAMKDDKTASFSAAREAYLAANKIDPEDPEPLYLFFDSFRQEGKRPTANAISALHYASVLAPQDGGVRATSAIAYMNEGKLIDARRELVPIAFNPHGGKFAEQARAAIERLDAKDRKGAFEALARGGQEQAASSGTE
jgi:tetratricopeptide (TPR) repeat protein